MTQRKDNSLVKEFQKVLLDDKDFLKNLLAEILQTIPIGPHRNPSNNIIDRLVIRLSTIMKWIKRIKTIAKHVVV